MEPKKKNKFSLSPAHLFVMILSGVFISEFLITVSLHKLNLVLSAEAVADSILLVLIMYPVIYFFAFRSLDMQFKRIMEEEKRFRTIYESSSDAIMIMDPVAGKFTRGNPATVKMFNTKDEAEFISLSPWNLSPETQPDGQPSVDKAKKMIGEAIEKGDNFFEWTHKRYNGENFSATVLLSRIKIGSKIMVQATVRDISKEKETMESLKKMNDLMVGRELKMLELKKEIERLNGTK
jgi:PAS domain S-box-containing protein